MTTGHTQELRARLLGPMYPSNAAGRVGLLWWADSLLRIVFSRLDSRRVALASAGVIALMIAGGIVDRFLYQTHLLDLDEEGNFPSATNALLYLFSGVAAFVVGRIRSRPWPWFAVAALLCYLGVDDAFAFHERMEATGIRWRYLYVPLVLVGAAVGLVTLRKLRHDHFPFGLFLAGGLFFALAFLLEDPMWDGMPTSDDANWDGMPRGGSYDVLMVIEETLEMTGAALIFLAMLQLMKWRGPKAVGGAS